MTSRNRADGIDRRTVIIVIVASALVLALLLMLLTGGFAAIFGGSPAASGDVVVDHRFEEELLLDQGAPAVAIGDPNAPFVLVEYSDFSCPHCYNLADGAIESLVDEYVTAGELRIVFKPVTFVNPPYSRPAARAFLCAAEQDAGWAMHDVLWALHEQRGPSAFSGSRLASEAEALGLDMEAFTQCFTSTETNDDLDAVMAEAQQVGVQGTPTLFLNGQQVPYQGPQEVYVLLTNVLEGEFGGE